MRHVGRIQMRMLRSKMIATVAFVLALGPAAYAQNVHLKPPHSNPTFFDLGLQLKASGELAGLGFGDVLVNMVATANVTATCTNPSGANQPPGQNPAPITVAGQQVIPQTEIKNGTTPFSVTTTAPTTPIPGAPGCPNPNWTEDITQLSFTTATITVFQPADSNTAVLTVSCTFNPATSDGPVPDSTVSCTTN